MREFFIEILLDLDKTCGLQQYMKLCALPNAKEEVNKLLDILCKTCNQFGLIPDEVKKKIIFDSMMRDQEFTSLNAKIIYKWLVGKNENYVKIDSEPTPADYKPLEGEARQEAIKRWSESFNRLTTTITVPQHSGTKIRESLDALSKSTNDYKPEPHEIIILKNNIKKVAADKYKDVKSTDLKLFEAGGIKIFALSQSEAEEIYIEALSI